MSQENIQPDTSQNEYATIEEAVFGEESSDNNVESAFTEANQSNEETAAPVIGQPAQETTEDSNDDKRYQYWQSQADKLKNENAQLRNAYNNRPPQQQVQQEVPVQESVEEFPPAPDKPVRPGHFRREEAYSDPASDSAKYLDAVESWRDDMSEYNTIRTQYDSAIVQEKFDKMEQQRINNAKRFQAAQTQNKQAQQIKAHVTGHYGMTDAQAMDFMQKMSNPNSLNIDNLVKLYQINEGGTAPQQQTTPAQPSDNFKQVQNAQTVPSPMGVMPSGQNNDGRSFEDKVMDNLIGTFESKNPWK